MQAMKDFIQEVALQNHIWFWYIISMTRESRWRCSARRHSITSPSKSISHQSVRIISINITQLLGRFSSMLLFSSLQFWYNQHTYKILLHPAGLDVNHKIINSHDNFTVSVPGTFPIGIFNICLTINRQNCILLLVSKG